MAPGNNEKQGQIAPAESKTVTAAQEAIRLAVAQPRQLQLAFFGGTIDARELIERKENQWFDRKSIKISARHLAECMIGFANADGGQIIVGIHQGQMEGVNLSPDHVNALMQADRDFAVPPVRNTISFVDCINKDGLPDRLMLIDVEASETIHRTSKGECFLRVGDETRRLGPVEERELSFDKGEAAFDKTIVSDLTLDDLDRGKIEAYAQKVGATNIESLMRSRGITARSGGGIGVTQAGWLLFATYTPLWSYIRYLEYEGTVAETGERSNLVEDRRLEGTLPELIEQAQALLREQIKSVIRLNSEGRFASIPSLPEFAWLEAVVNAVTHRSYSLQGDGIHVRQFSDRLEVQSPGRFPGLVRVDNIQNARFSRNPHIARILAEKTNFVRELNEGVRRMFDEMRQFGLPAPVYRATDTSVCVTLYKRQEQAISDDSLALRLKQKFGRKGQKSLPLLLRLLLAEGAVTTSQVASFLRVSRLTANRYLGVLETEDLLRHDANSANDPKGRWYIINSEVLTALLPELEDSE